MSTPPLTSSEAIHAWALACNDQDGFYLVLDALDQLEEEGRPVAHGLCEDLQDRKRQAHKVRVRLEGQDA